MENALQVLEEKLYCRNMMQSILDRQEKDRTEIGRELHDNISQVLSVTKLFLTTAEMENSLKDEMIVRSISNLSLAIESIRKLSRTLITPFTAGLGLADVIQDLAGAIQATAPFILNLHIKDTAASRLTHRQQVAIYRIIQEQLNNIIRHAEATSVILELEENENYVYLCIRDDGKGFNLQEKQTGIGLFSMQSRAELLNGKVLIQTEAGKGCMLKVDLPLDPDTMETKTTVYSPTI